jgi:formylglycine-generating enzyme required for sulfatase activity/predicted Ser/Thr protein kinase
VSEAQRLLSAFFRGEIDLAGLESALASAVRADPALQGEAIAELDALVRAGRLPVQLRAHLRARIESAGAQGALPAEAAEPAPGLPGPTVTPAAPAGASPVPTPATGAPAPTLPERTVLRPPPHGVGAATPTEARGPAPAPPAAPAAVTRGQPQPGEGTVIRPMPPHPVTAAPGAGPAPVEAPARALAEGTVVRPAPPAGPRPVIEPPPVEQPAEAATPTAATGPAVSGVTGPPGARERTTPTGAGATGPGTGPSTSSGWGSTGAWAEGAAEGLELAPGDTLKERFVLETILGSGGMGVVFKARDLRKEEAQDRNPYLAIKVLNKTLKRHPQSLKALQREARKAQSLAHPNIVTVYDFDRDGYNVFMTMEYLEGTSLDRLVAESRDGLPVDRVLALVREMGQALVYAHARHIVHSDFKPGNVFLTRDGRVKVFDFGIARAVKVSDVGPGEETRFDVAKELGAVTPAYASCEMLDGLDPDPRDDVYALACVTYLLLTGRHPFDRRKCTEARAAKLVPARAAGLNRRQWQALQRGLAFDRDRRSPSVDAFLDGLARRRYPTALVASAAAAALLLAVLGAITVPDLIQSRRVEALVATLGSGDDAGIAGALAALEGLGAKARADVTERAREAILGYYERQVDRRVDEREGRYDYAGAEGLLAEAQRLYPDSARVESVRSRVQGQKARQLNELTSRFNQYLEEGRLLATGAGDDLPALFVVLRQIDPQSPLLTDARLPTAYAQAAERAIAEQGFPRADALLQAGLDRFPDDPRLVNLRDGLRSERLRQEQATRVATVAARLEERAARLRTLEDYREARPTITELRDLDPDHPLLARVQATLQTAVDAAQQAALTARQWARAEAELRDLEGLLDPAYLQRRRSAVDTARAAYRQRIEDLYAQFGAALSARRLAPGQEGGAPLLLRRLEEAGADSDVLEQAAASVARTHLAMAREARAGERWDEARRQIQDARRYAASQPLRESLEAELEEIARAEGARKALVAAAEQERLEKERQAQIDALRERFRQALAAEALTIADARRAFDLIDQVAAITPADAWLAQGRGQVEDRLVAQLAELGRRERWEEARALARQSLQLIPESSRLASELARLDQAYQSAQARDREQEVQRRRSALAALLRQPTLSAEWEGGVRNELKALEALVPADDPGLVGLRQEAVGAYLGEARKMREAKRFAEARGILERGRRFGVRTEDLTREQEALAAAEASFSRESQEKARLAEIEGLKQTLLTQARANDAPGARRSLEELRKRAPADPFVTESGPQAIAEAYLRLAERPAKRKDYAAARKLLQAGLELSPRSTALQQALDRYAKDEKLEQARKAIAESPQLDSPQVKELIAEVRETDPQGYAALERELGDVVLKRLRAMGDALPGAAQSLLSDAQRLLPGAKDLFGFVPPAPTGPTLQERIAEVRRSLAESTRLDVPKLKDQLAELKTADPRAYAGLERDLADGVLKRLPTVAAADRRAAQTLLEDARRLLPGARELAEAALPAEKEEKAPAEKPAAAPGERLALASPAPCSSKLAGYGAKGAGRCYDVLPGDEKGPLLVVVPAGGGAGQSFAITKYEISIEDYNRYCKASGECAAVGGSASLPITGVSAEQARRYAAWLSRITGFRYRLPTAGEWVHAAEAGGSQPEKDFNCELRIGGNVVKGLGLLDVRSGRQNGWGLVNYVGNAQEWVQSGGGLAARGGAYSDSLSQCDIGLSRVHSGGPDKLTGFRLVREMGGRS